MFLKLFITGNFFGIVKIIFQLIAN